MIRLWTLEALAHGAEVVSYFRWRQAPFAQEQMHAGLNRSDGALDRGGEEAARVASELAGLDLAAHPTRQAPVALLHHEEAAWALAIQPHGAEFRYQRLVLAFYTALRRLGVDVDVRRPDAPLGGYRLIVVPCLPIAEDGLVQNLHGAGAVCSARVPARTTSHRIPEELPPGPLQAYLPIKVIRVESLPPTLGDGLMWGDRSHIVHHWREAIETALEPQARFADGAGAVFAARGWHYLAFWPDETFLTDYFERLLASAGVPATRLAETLRLRRRGTLTFAFNYDASPASPPAPPTARFVLGQRQMPPHGVAIWREP